MAAAMSDPDVIAAEIAADLRSNRAAKALFR
jgi:hypothetical protein